METHRYWRVTATSRWAGSGMTIGAISMRAAPGGAILAITGNGTASASNFETGSEPAKAFLGDETAPISPLWYTTDSGLPQWIQWDFGAGNEQWVGELKLWVSFDVRDPHVKDFLFQYSDDGSTWLTAKTGVTDSNTANSVTTFIVPEPGTITVNVAAPAPALYAYCGANSAIAAPSPTLFAIGGGIGADLTLPSPTLYATARSSAGDNDFTYTAPSPTLSAFGGASAKLSAPRASLNITATVVNFGEAALESPSATLSAAGKVSATGHAKLTFGNNLGAYNLVGYGGAVASITLTDSPTIQATGTTGSIGRASLSAPLFELTAEGTAHNYGSALISAPVGQMGGTARVWLVAPGATLTAIGSAVVTATYEAYAVNLNHRNTDAAVDETTRYTNFPFTHVVRYKNSYFGVNSTGLYLLEGTTDAGTDISYSVKTATSDFDSPNQKTVASAYFSGRIGPDATVTLHAGEGAGVPYAYTTPRGALAQNHRQVFGKGIKQHRYYSFGLSGSDALELDAIELDVKQMNRRI